MAEEEMGLLPLVRRASSMGVSDEDIADMARVVVVVVATAGWRRRSMERGWCRHVPCMFVGV